MISHINTSVYICHIASPYIFQLGFEGVLSGTSVSPSFFQWVLRSFNNISNTILHMFFPQGFWWRNSKYDDFQDDIIYKEQYCLQGHPQAYTRKLPRLWKKILKNIQGFSRYSVVQGGVLEIK
jgi:hypothetical protein